MKKRLICVLLMIALIVGMIPTGTLSVFADDDIFINISNEDELREFARRVNSGSVGANVTVNITDNIRCNNVFEQIGVASKPVKAADGTTVLKDFPFKGTFLGNGHTIFLDRITNGEAADNQALFGCTLSAVIKDLGVEGNINGKQYVAGLIAISANTDIINCHVSATVKASGTEAGAIIAKNEFGGRIINCSADGSVTAMNTAGGLVGSSDDENLIIENCYSGGKVTTESNLKTGAVIGSYSGKSIKNVYYNGEKNGDITAIGDVPDTDDVCAVYEYERKLNSGKSGAIIDVLNSYTAPEGETARKWICLSNGALQVELPYLVIKTDEDYMNAVTASVFGETYENKVILLDSNISISAKDLDNNIGCEFAPFKGYFDGGGKTIFVNASGNEENPSPFGIVSGGTVANLNVSGSIKTDNSAAGIVKRLKSGKLINCTNAAAITSNNSNAGGLVCSAEGDSLIINSVNSGAVKSGGFAGGIAASAYGNTVIENCESKHESFSVSGNQDVGGIVGRLYGKATVLSCKNLIAVNAESGNCGGIAGNVYENAAVINCENGMAFTCGGENTGGIAGLVSGNAYVANCINKGDITGGSAVGGIAGKNTASLYNCYVNAAVSGSTAGVIAGENTGSVINAFYNADGAAGGTDKPFGNETGAATAVNSGECEVVCQTNNEYIIKNYDITSDWKAWELVDNEPVLSERKSVSPFASGNGSKNNPYVISCLAELKYLAFGVGAGKTYKGKYIILNEDITGDGELVPIGGAKTAFGGNFNGNGHSVNISSDRVAEYGGLFGRTDGAVIENLTVSGSVTAAKYVGGIAGYAVNTAINNCKSTVSVKNTDAEYVGGIVGEAISSNISGCSVEGTIQGKSNVGGIAGAVTKCSVLDCNTVFGVYISAKQDNIGGIAGCADETKIDNSVNNAFVSCTSEGKNIGGIAGIAKNSSLIVNCKNLCDIIANKSSNAGGIAGSLTSGSKACNSVNKGGFEAYKNAGGICGQTDNGSILNCHTEGMIFALENRGIILGEATSSSAVIENCTYKSSDYTGTEICGNRSMSGAKALNDSEASDSTLTNYHNNYISEKYPQTKEYLIWGIDEDGEITYSQSDIAYEFAGGDGSEGNPYKISNLPELKFFSAEISKRKTDYKDKYIVLTNDIACDNNYIPAGTAELAFKGNFDGKGYTVTLDFNRDSGKVGLFGNVKGGSISNVITAGSVVAGGSEAYGGVVGYAEDTVLTNCYNKATITSSNALKVGGVAGYVGGSAKITKCRNSGNISGYAYIGGIVGYSNQKALIDCCENNPGTKLYASKESVGGIIGYGASETLIVNCVNSGDVDSFESYSGGIGGCTHCRVYNCANYGNISGDNCTGGISGKCDTEFGKVQLANCYNSGIVSDNSGGTLNTGTIVGHTSPLGIWNYDDVKKHNYYNKDKNPNKLQSIGDNLHVADEIPGYSDADCRGKTVMNLLNDNIVNPKEGVVTSGFLSWIHNGSEDIRPNTYANVECTHSFTETGRIPATSYSAGKHEYFYCSKCKNYFADEKGLCYIGDKWDFEVWEKNGQIIPVGKFYYFERLNSGEFEEKYLNAGEYTYLWNAGDTANDGWYVSAARSKNETEIEKDTFIIPQNKNVKLLLVDGASFNVLDGIQIHGNATLTVYGQSLDNPTGVLNADSSNHTAGIGPSYSTSVLISDSGGGSLTVNGGRIEAHGGDDGAGIGGTYCSGPEKHYSLAKIEINGGIVKAWGGKHAAGIGGGAYGTGENITINGGTVYAWGGGEYGLKNESYGAAGIGGAYGGDGKNITINGGTVYAYASGMHYPSFEEPYKCYNDGIGGAFGGHAQNIKLNGGFITSTGADFGSAFGGTDGFELSDNFNLWAGNSKDSATLQASYTGINQKYARLVEGKGKKYTVTYVDDSRTPKTLLTVENLDAGTIIRKPAGQTVKTKGYCDWYADKSLKTAFPFGDYFITDNITVYGKAHTHSLTEIEGMDAERYVNGYFSCYKCDYCELYFETERCEGFIGEEESYNGWKKNAGRRIYYIDYEDGDCLELQNTSFIKTVTASDTVWGEEEADSWYSIEKNVSISSRITVKGNVSLIIKDGCTLNAQSGITVEAGAALCIYAQSDGKGAGTLIAKANGYAAGIGGGALHEDAGDIIIGSGNIDATGGSFADMSANGGAGIGASAGGACGEIIINGGTVNAVGGLFAAGIGGAYGSLDGSVTVAGGTVNAKAGLYAAGIGGAMFSSGEFSIRIKGGSVTAVCGGTANPIGCGDQSYDKTEYRIRISKEMTETVSSVNTVCYVHEDILGESEDR